MTTKRQITRKPSTNCGRIGVLCSDGPWKGHTLYLSGHSTPDLQVGQNHGHYSGGQWIETPRRPLA